jgi:O-antigen ligase
VGSLRAFLLLLVISVLTLLPYFEGGETSPGLFWLHSLALAGFAITCLVISRISIPRFLLAFLPFFIVLVISTLISSYKFASFLTLWDYFAAGIWAILICTLVSSNREKFQLFAPWVFVISACSTIIAILLYNTKQLTRVSASFLNPNDYASYALLLFCFGLFCFEKEKDHFRKTILITFLSILLATVALSFSRGIFLAVLSLIVVTFILHKQGKVMKLLLLVLLVSSALIVVLRFRLYNDPYQYYRLKIWVNSLRSVKEDPYLGVGLGMLQYRSNNFNFPAETEVGRYAHIARTADNQYVQILAETGFLGFFTFLLGWFALLIHLKGVSNRFFYLKLAWLILTVTGLFSVPLQNTSVLFLFFFIIVFSIASDSEKHTISFDLEATMRILIPIATFLLFAFCVYLPYRADREFHLALTSVQPQEKEKHLTNALRYNPFQPYYRFIFIRNIVDARPQLDPARWMSLSLLLDQSIALNPLESEFYKYKARISCLLLQKNPSLKDYSDAISSYQAALDCNPFNVFLRLEFASFLFQLNRYDIAKPELEKILQLEPAFLNARLLLIATLLKTNHLDEAKTQYSRFLKDMERLRNEAAYPTSDYVRLLLRVNPQQKQKVMELYKKMLS